MTNIIRAFALPFAFMLMGDGHGLAQPFSDGTWYWLHDQMMHREGIFYGKSAGTPRP